MGLLQYFCFGCNSNQPAYVNENDKTITICPALAQRVWLGYENQTQFFNDKSRIVTTYDNCGLNVNGKLKIQSIDYKSY